MTNYRPQSSDTSAEAERWMIERYRRMAPSEKLAIFRKLSQATQHLALAGLRLRHPTATAGELRMRLAGTRLERDIMRDAFGWQSDS